MLSEEGQVCPVCSGNDH